MRIHTTKDIQLYDYGIDSWTPSRDTEELESKIAKANTILSADIAHVKAIQEAEKFVGGTYSFTTESLVRLITEVQASLANQDAIKEQM
jgi:hypothetical protein